MTEKPDPYPGEFTTAPQMDPEAIRARKKRNVWLGLALFGFVVLVGITTVIRLAGADLSNGAGFYYNASDSQGKKAEQPALPPGMTEDQATPPAPSPEESPE
ncbi:hypothetical protein [Hyphomonas johnsonii]|jgi:flagellar basal body-associated protein FliL|uniref:Cytochrome C oxidase assembly protein n=1 Tax=Hyphomonas johnsonii MHS-2 TaxID=1280950 RepID=A0A059FT83_9PROT|nr:hypothetical protein [Hyphomonas johnsonii]KCZ93879.1 hypothetical protein HJO_00850 [Hyphomonas johnsonii MHS-2]